MTSLLTRLETKISDLRSIHALVIKKDFDTLYQTLSDGERELVKTMVLSGRRDEFKEFVKNKRDLEACSLTVLRRIASCLMIYNYSRMCKAELIKEIRDVQR